MASVTDKYLAEIKQLELAEEATPKEKLDFIEKQLEGFRIQAYRYLVDAQVAEEYIKIGTEGKVPDADKYIETGQQNIQQAVGHLRSIKVNIAQLCKIRDQLKKS